MHACTYIYVLNQQRTSIVAQSTVTSVSHQQCTISIKFIDMPVGTLKLLWHGTIKSLKFDLKMDLVMNSQTVQTQTTDEPMAMATTVQTPGINIYKMKPILVPNNFILIKYKYVYW